MGLWPQGLAYDGACHWRDWDPEAATGPTEGLIPAAGGVRATHLYIGIFPTSGA